MKKAIIYARQSSGKDDFSESVENQIENCKKLAEKENLEIIGIFSDLNTSGKTYPTGAENIAANDEAFNRWFTEQKGNKKFRAGLGKAFLHLSEADYLIVDEMTRLYRPVTRSFLESYINEKLAGNGVKILQVKGGKIDLSKFDASLIQMLKNAIQDEAIANQKAKAAQQYKKLRASGFYGNGGGKAFGTVKKPDNQIEITDRASEAIKFIFDGICNYMPYNQIIKTVNERFSDCFRGKSFYQSNFYAVAKNPIYCGYMLNDDKLLIKNQQIINPCINFDQWQQAQNILSEKRKNPVRASRRSLPFRGLLYCGHCGASMVSATDKTSTFYACKAGRDYNDDINCKQSRLTYMFKKEQSGDWSDLRSAIAPLLVIGLFDEMKQLESAKHDAQQLEALKVDLKNMQEKQNAVMQMFLKGNISEEQMENILIDYKTQINALQQQIIKAESSNPDEATKHLRHVGMKLKAFSLLDDIEDGEFEKLLKKSVLRIDSYFDRLKIKTVFGDFELPRIIYKNRRNFPKPEIVINGKEDFETIITYHTGKCAVLADWGKIRIITK